MLAGAGEGVCYRGQWLTCWQRECQVCVTTGDGGRVGRGRECVIRDSGGYVVSGRVCVTGDSGGRFDMGWAGCVWHGAVVDVLAGE